MKLKKKIRIGYCVVVAFMVAAMAWVTINLVFLEKTTNTLLHDNYRSILAAENMVNAIERQDSGILLLLIDEHRKGIDQFRGNEGEFLKWLARAKDNISINEEVDLIQKIETDYTAYRQQFSSLTDLPNANKDTLASFHNTYTEKIQPIFTEIRQNCIQLRQLNHKTMLSAAKTAERVSKQTLWILALATAALFIGLLIFKSYLIDPIVMLVQNFTAAFQKISSNDFPATLPVEGMGELAGLTDRFNRMADQLGQRHQSNIERVCTEKSKGEVILASIEDGLIIFDTHLAVTDINPAARRMLYLTSVETSPLKCSEILAGTPICAMITKIVEKEQHFNIPDEQRMITLSKGEQFRHCLYSITAIYGDESKLTGIVLLLRDVSRLKEVERLKNEFVLAASHELRTPLTTLGMSIDSLRQQVTAKLGNEEKNLLEAAHEEVHRMKALVNDLLDLSKVESNRIAIEFESVPVGTLFKYIQKVFKGQMERKSVALTGEFSEDLPNIRADANKITWVLSNLVSNAMRYVGDGGHIQIIANRIGPQIHMSVRDDGPGIPLDYQSKIFQKYVRVKGQESGGTGLGLAICKEIVRAHGGGIWVESLPGQGSTFTFTLPLAH